MALVDELAHTNVPGSDREKRWQDVEVIRDAGIHVISTCNVQHLESVADAVATITGAPVNERLPDEVLEDADEVELVDMSPHALRQRMRHGNVYPPERTRIALDRFFTESNLTALRELVAAVRRPQVDEQLDEMARRVAPGPEPCGWSPNASSWSSTVRAAARRALRRGGQLASALHGPLLALVVETPTSGRMAFDSARDLRENLDFATDLGAEVVRVEASDLVTGVTEVARHRRVTQLVLPHHESGGLGGFAASIGRGRGPPSDARARCAPGRRPRLSGWCPVGGLVLAGIPKYGLVGSRRTHTFRGTAGRTLPLRTPGARTVEECAERGNDHMASMAVNELGPMLTATEVAEMLHLHVNTVKRLGDRGELPFYRVCKRGDRRFRLDDVMKFLAQNR